jgi:hypothetical protein
LTTFGYTTEEVEEYKLSLPPKISEQPYVSGKERIGEVREEIEVETPVEEPAEDPVVMTHMGIDFTQSQVDRLKAAAETGDKDAIREAINQTAIENAPFGLGNLMYGKGEGTISERQLSEDEEFVADYLQYREDRFGTSKDTGAGNFLIGSFVGATQEATPENFVDDYLDHYRNFTQNTMVGMGEVGWLESLTEQEKEARDAGDIELANEFAEKRERAARLYLKAEKLAGPLDSNRYENMGAWDVIGDVAETAGTNALIMLGDPLTAVSAGIGKVVGGGLAATGMSPLKSSLIAALTAAPIDAVAAGATDLAIQTSEIEMGIREEIDYGRTAQVTALSTVVSAGLSGTAVKVTESRVDKVTKGKLSKALKDNQKAQETLAKETNERLGQDAKAIRERLAEGIEKVYGTEAILRNKDGDVTGINSAFIRDLEEAKALKKNQNVDLEDIQPSITFGVLERTVATMGELIENARSGKIKIVDNTGDSFDELVAPIQKNEMVSERLLNILSNVGEESQDDVARILGKYGITRRELAASLFAEASWAGKVLREFRRLGDVVGHAGRTKTAEESADAAVQQAMKQSVGNLFRRAEDIRRLALVSAIPTAVRNNISQVLRSGIEMPIYAMETIMHTLARTMGAKNMTKKFGIRSILAQAEHTFYDRKDAATLTQFMLEIYPKQKGRFYNQYSEVTNTLGKTNKGQNSTARLSEGVLKKTASKALDKVEGFMTSMNYMNRLQEAVYRNGMFSASLQRQMYDKGLDMFEVANSGKITENITEDMISKAVDDALEFTYASQPKFAPFRYLNNLIVQSGFTLAIPFPRFMFKAIEMTYNYNITGAATGLYRIGHQLISKGEMSEGAVRQLSEGIAGGMPLIALGYAMRDPEGPLAGSDWYMLNDGQGNEFDARPYFPLTPYLYIGELLHRYQEDRPDKFRPQEMVQAFTGTNFRGMGPSGKFLEDIVTYSTSGDDPIAFQFTMKEIGKYLGEALSGYGQPIWQVGDILSFKDPYTRLRDYKTDPEGNTALANFFSGVWEPFDARLSRVVESAGFDVDDPYREDPRFEAVPERVMPFMKVMLGATLTRVPPDYVKDLNRLGFQYQDFMAKTNSDNLNKALNREMGILMNTEMPELLQTLREQYGDDNDAIAAEVKNYISVLKSTLYAQIKTSDEDALLGASIQRFNRLGPLVRNATVNEFRRMYDREPDYRDVDDVGQLVDIGSRNFKTMAKQRK